MQWWIFAFVASAAIPLAFAWRANRGWTIRHAIAWSWPAWLAWLGYAGHPCTETAFASLTFTAAAAVAVLGARRPGVVAWNFIVVSLLIVLWLGWAEGLLDGWGPKLGTVRLLFVSALLLTATLNYLPTSFAAAIGIAAIGCAGNIRTLWMDNQQWSLANAFHIACATWIAWLSISFVAPKDLQPATDRLWREFRNRYGAIWAERLREQFNVVSKNNGWPMHLAWTGMKGNSTVGQSSLTVATQPPDEERGAVYHTALDALMKRFRYD